MFRTSILCALSIALLPTLVRAEEPQAVDFNRDIRAILSNKCFTCHGPDEKERKGGTAGLRLDTREGACEDLGGYAAIVPGNPDESELVRRIKSEDEGELMPPPGSGKEQLTPHEIELITQWIAQGAEYAKHWSYEKPIRPALPSVNDATWPRNEIDYFILSQLESRGLKPSPEADRYTLIRRVALDLTGLPPTIEEVDRFVQDTSEDAYEQLVDRLLEKKSYGEHWARSWLDLARYADSAGYADDPPRTIWGYRDYVIRSFNENKPFDQFTIEQIAGDLLPAPTTDQLVATAFHRNTLTNNEGGTNDEEFRNVAVVDRVNTTMAVWMGTTMACAQCHTHKYDPITQEEYFRFFAILNNTQDADLRDESPTTDVYTDEQMRQKAEWQQRIDQLNTQLATPTPELLAQQGDWETTLANPVAWTTLSPSEMSTTSGAALRAEEDHSIVADRGGATEDYQITLPLAEGTLSALRLETLPDAALPGGGAGYGNGNFVITEIQAAIQPPAEMRPQARFVRIELPGKQKILSLAEVQTWQGETNIAVQGTASQSSTAFGGPPELAIDGNTDGRFSEAMSTTHTDVSDDPWWELDLKQLQAIDRLEIFNRTDNNLQSRLSNFVVKLLDDQRQVVWQQQVAEPPDPSRSLAISMQPLSLASAIADYAQEGFAAADTINNPDPATRGWAVGGQITQPHALTIVPTADVVVRSGSHLVVTIRHKSKHEHHTLGRFRLSVTSDSRAGQLARTPDNILTLLRMPADQRTDAQRSELTAYYLRHIAPALQPARDELDKLTAQLADMKPATTVPVMRELSEDKRRTTKIQLRGNFLDTDKEVQPGLPKELFDVAIEGPLDRLKLAEWLIHPDNPLTPRVVANRYWEQIFGIGIVSTSEEFGSQGELPSHPELLDWLATEIVARKWDLKSFLKLLVTSAAYRQSSRVTPELLELDPDNRLLARGPRFRLSAETIRDQALYVSGLLSPKMFGPPVKPPQPAMGVSAAFGSGIDWQTSEGEDRYRRGLYTTWRRSNPYPSMSSFDAPNREVCTIRRDRTNTPLQALVTLNDPVYIEAAQKLSQRMRSAGADPETQITHGFRLCLARPPQQEELQRLIDLLQQSRQRFAAEPDQARYLASLPEPVEDAEAAEAAAWTVVANVLLNLDEVLMKR